MWFKMIYNYDLKKNKLPWTKNSQIHLKSTKQFDLYTSSFTDFINNMNNDFFILWKAYEDLHSIMSLCQKTFQPMKNSSFGIFYLEYSPNIDCR